MTWRALFSRPYTMFIAASLPHFSKSSVDGVAVGKIVVSAAFDFQTITSGGMVFSAKVGPDR